MTRSRRRRRSQLACVSPLAGEACTELHSNTQTQDRRGLGQSPATMSMLRQHETKSNLSLKLVTQ